MMVMEEIKGGLHGARVYAYNHYVVNILPLPFEIEAHRQVHRQRRFWNENCPILPFCSTIYVNSECCNMRPSHYTFNRNKYKAERHEDLPWAHGASIKEGLVNNSVSNGPFVWHPRGLHTLGHRTITRFKMSERHAFLYKTGYGKLWKGSEKEVLYLSLQIHMLSQREKI